MGKFSLNSFISFERVFKNLLILQTLCCVIDFNKGIFFFRRSPISVAAAAIYMASQASEDKKSQKGFLSFLFEIMIIHACVISIILFSYYFKI